MSTQVVIPSWFVSLAQYSELHGVTDRTVKRWLAGNELPGAYKDGRGAWQIPKDAVRTIPDESAQQGMVPAPRAEVTPTQYDAPAPVAPAIPAGRTFFTAAEAAALMSCPELVISEYAVKKHREYYHAIDSGPNGAIIVPAYRLLQLKGILPQ